MVWNVLRFGRWSASNFGVLSLALGLLLWHSHGKRVARVDYDFPGTQAALASGRRPATSNVTFGDWSRVNISASARPTYSTQFWNTTRLGFYTYASLHHGMQVSFELDTLSFDEGRTAGGRPKLVEIFINGSATVYDSFNYNPSSSTQIRRSTSHDDRPR